MHRNSGFISTSFLVLLLGTLATFANAQQLPVAVRNSAEAALVELPEAPMPEGYSAAEAAADPQQSSSTAPAEPPAVDKSKHAQAEEQLKEEEKQRVFGVLPGFNISYRSDAVSLTASQKFRLAFRSAVDPWTFFAALSVAGIHEATDSDQGFGWGPEGYGKRAGAAYLDAFDGGMIGNALLPSILHQDPRFFRLGHGSVPHRALYAAGTAFLCKHDNTGKWEPNYSNVGGNIAAGAISNLYYPSNQSGIGQTIGNAFIVTAEGAVASTLQEFWPDISRKFFHKDPTHGLDAQMRAADQAKKAAKQSGNR